MSISTQLLSDLQNSIYVSNGAQVVNIDGPRGFTVIVNTPRVFTGAPRVVFDKIEYNNSKFNISDQVKLNSSGNWIIEPVPYHRTLTLHVNIWTGGLSTPPTTNLIFGFFIPTTEVISGAAEFRNVGWIQHGQSGGMNKSFHSMSFLIPKNAYDFRVDMGTSPYYTSLYALKIYGILSA